MRHEKGKQRIAVRMDNAGIRAIETIQTEMAGEADRTGLDSDEKIVKFCREIRRGVYQERYANLD